MKIPLLQFEDYIDETILQRGLQYFKKGYVQKVEEISPGEYIAKVEGSKEYTIQLSIKNGIITEHVCDCPYDYGPVCKHLAAVIFDLQQDVLGIRKRNKKAKATQSSKSSKRKTISQQVDEVLEKVTHDELKQFIQERISEDAAFRNLFLSLFAHHNSDESKELYTKQIKSILKAASDRHGFIDWSSAMFVGKAVSNLLSSAQKQINNRHFKSAFFICTAVMEQMMLALQYADDSNADIGDNIRFAYTLLNDIARDQSSEEIRKLIIDYCFTSYDKQVYADWEWHTEILRLASSLLRTEEETERLFKQIDKAESSDYDYKKEEAQSIKYNVLLKTKGDSVAEKYLEQHLANSNLRRIAIEMALKEKNFEKATSLALDGVNSDMKEKRGLVTAWYNWLLKIAQAQNDTEKIIEYARKLLLDNFRNEQDYYQILKQTVEPEKWNAFVESIILDISTKRGWFDTELLASIFINQEWWDRLLKLLQQKPNLDAIEYYENFLLKDYLNEIVDLYAICILAYMKNSLGRKHYKYACRYIRKMKKLGGKEKAVEVITYLRTEYPRRKALIEELEKI